MHSFVYHLRKFKNHRRSLLLTSSFNLLNFSYHICPRLDLASVRLLSADIISTNTNANNANTDSSGNSAVETSSTTAQQQPNDPFNTPERVTAAALMSAVAWKQNEAAWAPVLKWAAEVGVRWSDELKEAYEADDNKKMGKVRARLL